MTNFQLLIALWSAIGGLDEREELSTEASAYARPTA